MTSRLEALAKQLKLPLLVTNLVNVRYLTGFDSSNAALLVRPKGDATLYTDFRYIEEARQVEAVDVQITKRSLIQDVAAKLSGRVQFEADVVPHLQWERLGAGRITARSERRHRRHIARRQGRGGARRDRPRRTGRRSCVRGTDRRDMGRPEREGARLAPARAAPRARRRRRELRGDRRLGPERREAARETRRHDPRTALARGRRLGRSRRRVLQRLHAHVVHRQPARAAPRGVRGVPRGAAARL